MSTAIILPHVLAVVTSTVQPPENDPDPFRESMDHTETVVTGDDVSVIAFDKDNEIIGVLTGSFGPNGSAHLAADFDDGYWEIVLDDPHAVPRVQGSLTPGIVESRVRLMSSQAQSNAGSFSVGLSIGPRPEEGYFTCGMGIMGSVVSCSSAAPWCPLVVLAAACSCLPLIDEDAAAHECW